MESPPVTPCNGRILVRQLPYKPSKIIEAVSIDKAVENEGIVETLSPHRYARRKTKRGWEMTGAILPHEVKVGDRVIFPGSYQDDDVQYFNGEKYRYIESWDVCAIIHAEQPQGLDNPITGEKLPEIRLVDLTSKVNAS